MTKLTREQLDEPNTCDHCDGSSPADCGWCAGVTFTPALPKHEPAAKQPSLTREQLDERTLGILERAYAETYGSGEHDQFVQMAHEYWHRLIAQARRALELEELCAQKVRTHCKECNSAWDARYGQQRAAGNRALYEAGRESMRAEKRAELEAIRELLEDITDSESFVVTVDDEAVDTAVPIGRVQRALEMVEKALGIE